jgi:hypothetical protein
LSGELGEEETQHFGPKKLFSEQIGVRNRGYPRRLPEYLLRVGSLDTRHRAEGLFRNMRNESEMKKNPRPISKKLTLKSVLTVFALFLTSTFAFGPTASAAPTCYTVNNGLLYNANSCTGAIVIDSSATFIVADAFYGSTITSVVIPDSVIGIGAKAFEFIPTLTSVTIGNGVSVIYNNAFFYNANLVNVTIGNSVQSIGEFAFASIPATSITLPASVRTISDYAFRYGSLSTVTIPTDLTSLSSTAFQGNPLTRVTYCGTNTSVLAAIRATIEPYCATNVSPTPSASASPSPTPTRVLSSATLDSLTFKDDGTGTGGKLSWTGKLIDSVLYEGPASTFPGAFSYGSYNSSWNGNLVNLTPDTEYTFKLSVISKDGVGTSKSITVKTEKAGLVVRDLAYWSNWLAENTYVSGEAANIYNLLAKFDALKPGTSSTTLKIPTSRVSTASAKSNTPSVCVMSDAATIKSIAKGTCTISYTVVGKSKAPATLVKSFTFKKFAK